MELIQVGEKTYYLKNPTNIGIYKVDDTHVFLIDTGNDKDAGKKILKIVEEKGWQIIGIINTHSHADHIGGNKVIQENTNCPIYAYQKENCFINNPILEPSLLYGGNPIDSLKNKFLYAKESLSSSIEGNLPEGLEYIVLKGHSTDMIGIKTSDNVFFLGDAIISKETIQKYHLFYLYDIEQTLSSLQILKELEGTFIPSHVEACTSITELIDYNQRKIEEILSLIIEILKEPIGFEELLQKIFDKYSLAMNVNQYFLIGSTIRSYLSYLYHQEKITYEFIDNKMMWKTI